MSQDKIPITMTRGEGGWTFTATHNWADYSGTFSPDSLPETDLMRQVLTAKPELFTAAWPAHSTRELAPDSIVVAVPFPALDELVMVRLYRVPQNDGERVQRQMPARIAELEGQVAMLQGRVRRLEIGQTGLQVPGPIKDDQLMRFATAFREDYQLFAKQQLNTTEMGAFVKWLATLGTDVGYFHMDYLARVRRLSMCVPLWSSHEATGSVAGLYQSGCWRVNILAPVSVHPSMRILGPFTFQNNVTQFFLSVIDVEPISVEDKERLQLE
jgi:hypothetical protein